MVKGTWRTRNSRYGMRRSYGGYRGRGTLWSRHEFNSTTPIPADSALWTNLLPDSTLDPGARIGSTVTRVRLRVQLTYDDVIFQSDPGLKMIWVGCIVMPNNVTPAQVLGPHTHSGSDWFMWDVIPPNRNRLQLGTTLALIWDAYDIKSQRRLTDQYDVPTFVIQPNFVIGSVKVIASTLIKRAT